MGLRYFIGYQWWACKIDVMVTLCFICLCFTADSKTKQCHSPCSSWMVMTLPFGFNYHHSWGKRKKRNVSCLILKSNTFLGFHLESASITTSRSQELTNKMLHELERRKSVMVSAKYAAMVICSLITQIWWNSISLCVQGVLLPKHRSRNRVSSQETNLHRQSWLSWQEKVCLGQTNQSGPAPSICFGIMILSLWLPARSIRWSKRHS